MKHKSANPAAPGALGLEVFQVPYLYYGSVKAFLISLLEDEMPAMTVASAISSLLTGLKWLVKSSAISGGALKLCILDSLPYSNFLM